MPKFLVTISGTVEIEAENEEAITVQAVISELHWADKPRAYVESVEQLEDARGEA